MDVNDPSGVFHIAYTTEGGSNYGRMSDPKVDELADRALQESNKDKRKQAYWELQRYILTRGDTADGGRGVGRGMVLHRQEASRTTSRG